MLLEYVFILCVISSSCYCCLAWLLCFLVFVCSLAVSPSVVYWLGLPQAFIMYIIHSLGYKPSRWKHFIMWYFFSHHPFFVSLFLCAPVHVPYCRQQSPSIFFHSYTSTYIIKQPNTRTQTS